MERYKYIHKGYTYIQNIDYNYVLEFYYVRIFFLISTYFDSKYK